MRTATTRTLSVIAAAVLSSSMAWAQPAESAARDLEQVAEDAWIDGRLEGAYIFNEHLSAAAIDTDVNNGIVTLSGTVESDIDRDLAAEIAKGMKGVVSVDNRLRVEGDAHDGAVARDRDVDRDGDLDADTEDQRSFGQWVNDATTSAAVKAALIRNENIRAGEIDVDTVDDVVTLRGVVATEEQKELAERLARNTRDVEQVRNELRVEAG